MVNSREVVVAVNLNQTSSSGVPELDEHAPEGVTLEFVPPALDWLLRQAVLPLVGIAGNAVAPVQLSFAGAGGGEDMQMSY